MNVQRLGNVRFAIELVVWIEELIDFTPNFSTEKFPGEAWVAVTRIAVVLPSEKQLRQAIDGERH